MNVKEMLKLGVVLAIFATAACVMLAFVYAGTAPIIAEREKDALNTALREVFPDADNFEPTDAIDVPDGSVRVLGAFQAMRGGEVTGALVRVSAGGFGGPIVLIIGVDAEGVITGVRILDHSETPGFGANAASASYYVEGTTTFYGQYTDKKYDDPLTLNSDVIPVSGATITSRAVNSSIKAVATAAKSWLDGAESVVDHRESEEARDE